MTTSITRIGSEILVNTATNNTQVGPQITALAGGGFVVTWSDNSRGFGGVGATGDDSGSAIKAQVFTANGNTIGSEILVNTATANDQTYAQITALSNGGFVVTWQDLSYGVGGATGDSDNLAVKAQVFSADGSPIGSERLVNTATAGGQANPQITSLTNGGFVVTWEDFSRGVGGATGDNSRWAIKAQVFAADGASIGSELLVNTASESDQQKQQITALSNGGFVVTWLDYSLGIGGASGDNSSYAVKAQVFAPSGTPIGSEHLVNSATMWNQDSPQISALLNGGFVVTWKDDSGGVGGVAGDDSGSAVKAQMFTADGTPNGLELLVNTATANSQGAPQITALSNGGFVVTWEDGSLGVGGATGDSSISAIKAQVFGANGAPIGSEILVNTATAYHQWHEQITALANGGFVVTWEDESHGVGGATGDNSGYAVKAQTFGADGSPIGSELLVNTATNNDQSGAQIAALSNGGFVVTWNDGSQGVGGANGDSSLSAVKAQVFSVVTDAYNMIIGTDYDDLLTGSEGDDWISGISGNDTIYAYGGNDIVDGGPDADTMYGGSGDDLYVVDDSGDIVIENNDDGIDNVESSISYTLTPNVENLILKGSADISGSGNELDNTLTGNAGGANILDGAAGDDTMIGGAGHNTYFVDSAGDQVIEHPNEGTDTVNSSINYTLGDNVENLILLGSANLDGTGNALSNVIYGSFGNNIIDGALGGDILLGKSGNDIYVVDSSTDYVIEKSNEGLDEVKSTISYTLSVNVENLTLIGSNSINGTGNLLNNILNGNSASNQLIGLQGSDTLQGAGGNDTYLFNLNDGQDTISDIDATSGNFDQIVFGAGITVNDLIFTQSGTSLLIGMNGTTDQITIIGQFEPAGDKRIESLLFADGTQKDIRPSNLPPVAVDDSTTVAEGGVVTTVNVLSNDTDADTTLTAAMITGFTPGANGTVVYNNDGTFTYTHNGSETSSDNFTYTLNDGAGGTDTATVNVTVTPVNDAATIGGTSGGSITEDALPNIASGTLTIADVDSPATFQSVAAGTASAGGYGTYAMTTSGVWTYALNNGNVAVNALNDGQYLSDSFTVYAADNTSKVVNISINGHTDVVAGLAPTDIQWYGVRPSDTAPPLRDTSFATLTTVDPDSSSFTYALQPGSSPGFSVTGGVVSRSSNLATGQTYELVVKSTDPTNKSYTETFTIKIGTSGNNLLNGTPADDIVYGLGGNDIIFGGNGDDTLFGQSSMDVLSGGDGRDSLTGGLGNDVLNGGNGDDSFNYRVGDGADVMDGANDDDSLAIVGTSGNDMLNVLIFNENIRSVGGGMVSNIEQLTLALGAGNDTLSYTGTIASVAVNLSTSNATGFISISGVENVTGGWGNDALTGDGLDNAINGGAGGDTLYGGAGADKIDVGIANDNVQDHVVYEDSNEGGAGEVISDFDSTGSASQVDSIDIGGLLRAALDNNANGNLTFGLSANSNNSNTAVNLSTIEALYLAGTGSDGVSAANLTNPNAIAAEFNAEFNIIVNNGEQTLLVVNDNTFGSNQAAVWFYTENATPEIQTSELTLIGVVQANAGLQASQFDLV